MMISKELNIPNLEEAVEEMRKHCVGSVGTLTSGMSRDCFIIEWGFTPREDMVKMD